MFAIHNYRNFVIASVAFILTIGVSSTLWAQNHSQKEVQKTVVQDVQSKEISPYPLSYCIVTGLPLGKMGPAVSYNYKNRQILFCCPACEKKFKANPDEYLSKLDAAIIKEQKPNYPLSTCPVSGQKLDGKMGEPVDYVYGNRLIRFCCKNCVQKFKENPQAYEKALNQKMLEKEKENYPLQTCVVTGEQLGKMGPEADTFIGNQLVRLCCKGCLAKVQKEPYKYLAKIKEAQSKKK